MSLASPNLLDQFALNFLSPHGLPVGFFVSGAETAKDAEAFCKAVALAGLNR